jgi:two-component system CheB/CheR fusion protein
MAKTPRDSQRKEQRKTAGGGRARGSAKAAKDKAGRAAPAEKPARGPVHAEASKRPFPIVGIGASAGGLEALELFLANLPPQSGMAFVIVQHLDPSHKGMLVELLRRKTTIPIEEIADGQTVLVDHAYVIPPNRGLSIDGGRLRLLAAPEPPRARLPIDFFFRSLAEDQKECAVGVILSGTGTDGTLGLRAIKEKAGAVFVQAPVSAKFDGMPRSAIDAGLADVVAPAQELPGMLMAYRKFAPYIEQAATDEKVADPARTALEKVFILLRAQTGHDFSRYKRSTIYRRIERRMSLHQIGSIGHYVRFLRENRREIELLFKELLIGVTCFFRDVAPWDHLKETVLPVLLASRAPGSTLRAWIPGCSTGEEAYSLAMIFKEAVEALKPAKNLTLQIFATDLDRDAIERARAGIYPDNISADVSPERLRRFFLQDERGFRVGKEIREMVVFAPQNLIMDPPFTKLDILTCRNLLIYLSSDLQKKLIPLFHYSLNPEGVLFLGSAETIGSFTNLFSPFDGKTRLYRRCDSSVASLPVEFPSTGAPAALSPAEHDNAVVARGSPPNLQALVDRVLFLRHSPLGVLTNDKGDILYISARAGRYLEPSVGKANLNLFAMARDGLRFELSRAFSTALRESRPVVLRGIRVGTNGAAVVVDATVQRLGEPKELLGTILTTIAEAPEPVAAEVRRSRGAASDTDKLSAMGEDLLRARDEIQTTREEMQTSQEELKSTNEELQSTNEELQSTNEELTTSKEEMQSLNEELQTVNAELEAKVDELSRSNNDMKNLLNSTDIATLFLDAELNVRRFTTPTSRIIKLIPGDAGRPITDIASALDYPDLAEDAREVLRTLVFKERQTKTRDGRWFVVRILPYRTLENVIDGVVITFTDASASRALEAMLRDQAKQLRQMTESIPHLVWGCRGDGSCDYVSRRWAEYTGLADGEQLGFGWLEQVHADDRGPVRAEWRRAIRNGAAFEAEFRLRDARGRYRWFCGRSVPIHDAKGTVVKWYGANIDVDDLKRAEDNERLILKQLALVADHIDEGFFSLDEHLSVVFFSRAAARIFGRERSGVLGKRVSEALPELHDSSFEQKLKQASRQGKEVRVDIELKASRAPGWYALRIFPSRQGAGTSVFVGRRERRERSGRHRAG